MPRLFSDVGDWFGSELAQFWLGAYPLRVEDFQDKDQYVLRAELPGVDPERDVRVSVDNGVLTVEAQRTEETHDKHRAEFRYGLLRRSVTLPARADQEKISARYDKGILEVGVPLRGPEPSGRSIPVEHAD
jgi:HSP20 family protein